MWSFNNANRFLKAVSFLTLAAFFTTNISVAAEVTSRPLAADQMLAPAVQLRAGEMMHDFSAQVVGLANPAKKKGNISHRASESPMSVNEHIEKAYGKNLVADYTASAQERLRTLLQDQSIVEVLKKNDVQDITELARLLEETRFYVAANPENNSPTLVVLDAHNYQIAHVGLGVHNPAKSVYIAKGIMEELQSASADTLLNTLLLRELVVLWRAGWLMSEEHYGYDAAVEEAEAFAEYVEKDLVQHKLDAFVQRRVDRYLQYKHHKIEQILGEVEFARINADFVFGNYQEHTVDREKSAGAIEEMEKIFGEQTGDLVMYHIVSFRQTPIAFVREDGVHQRLDYHALPAEIKGVEHKHVFEDVDWALEQGHSVVDALIQDYLFLKERTKKKVQERFTLDYREMRLYATQYAKEERVLQEEIAKVQAQSAGRRNKNLMQQLATLEAAREELQQRSPLNLTGGKGLSLSLMDGVVDVPAGCNITTTAYFEFIRGNPQVWDLIDAELKNLDAIDDQQRDVVSDKIRHAILNAEYGDEIAREISVMYRQLNVMAAMSGKPTPVAVAIRSSGIKEDIHIESWLPQTSGSQAGQSDTFLNVKGWRHVLGYVKRDFASLFTDRAISYRDETIFQMFASTMGIDTKEPKDVYRSLVGKLYAYAEKYHKPLLGEIADTLTRLENPGAVNLMRAMNLALSLGDDPEIRACLEKMQKVAAGFLDPDKIGIDVVMMNMVKSYVAGVAFTVDPETKNSAVSNALYSAWMKDDRSMVYLDAMGMIVGTKPMLVSFEASWGYGENVVGGKVDPDKVVLGTNNGRDWFIIKKQKGSKLIQMIDLEEAMSLLTRGDHEREAGIRRLSDMLGQAVAYEEVGKRINNIMVTELKGTEFVRDMHPAAREQEPDNKKARVQNLAEFIANLVKDGEPAQAVKDVIMESFIVVASRRQGRGLLEETVDTLVADVYRTVDTAREDSKKGMQRLATLLGSQERAVTMLKMVKEVWENKEEQLIERDAVLRRLGFAPPEFRNFTYLVRSLLDASRTANVETTEIHQNTFAVTDDTAKRIAAMVWDITTYYKDRRDVEFGIEIDPFAPADKALKGYIIDLEGRVMNIGEGGALEPLAITRQELAEAAKTKMMLYNVQARPYTAKHIEVNVERSRTVLDTGFVRRHALKPLVSGTKGENATHAYTVVFDPSKSIAYHADMIRRLKKGDFTPREKNMIKRAGINPDDYNADNPLPVALYLLEADPSHDPIMKLVNAVLTIRGGETCHAAIFCREQGIPAVTGTGKIKLKGDLLATGTWVTVDANNGTIYELDKDESKRIPVREERFKIKPFAIPGDEHGFSFPKIGDVIAAESAAQMRTPMMLAIDSAGNALTRAEFKGEELGINVFAGYGYDLLRAIERGEQKAPERVLVADMLRLTGPGDRALLQQLTQRLGTYLDRHRSPALALRYRELFGKELQAEGMRELLPGFDLVERLKKGEMRQESLADYDKRLLGFLKVLPEDTVQELEHAYGILQRRYNFDFHIVDAMRRHDWIMADVEKKLQEQGYASFKAYAGEKFYYFYNLMGFTVSPDAKAKNRAYDFAQDKVRGLFGSEIFSWPGVNPLVGLRGASLEIEGVDQYDQGNQRVLDFLLEAVIDADADTGNQAWFYVFIRFPREMEMLDIVLERIAQKKGRLPKQIGIMIEVPSNAMLAEKLGRQLLAMRDKYAQTYGVESTFFSFGTNDYGHLLGMGDREDPRMKLTLLDPAALRALSKMKAAGYYYDDTAQVLPLIFEGSENMLEAMEAVIKEANALGIATSLCGEAVTALVNSGQFEKAGRLMAQLDSFGISMIKVRPLASMVRYDNMAGLKRILTPAAQRQELFDLKAHGTLRPQKGIISGEVLYIDSADDLVPERLRGFTGEALKTERKKWEMQGPAFAQSTVNTYGKIVVLSRNLVALRESDISAGLQAYVSSADARALFTRLQEDGYVQAVGTQAGANLYAWTNLATTAKYLNSDLVEKGYTETQRNAVLAAWTAAWDQTADGLSRRGIDWDDLQYAKAIFIDAEVPLTMDVVRQGRAPEIVAIWDVLTLQKGIVPLRVKGTIQGISSEAVRKQLSGRKVTIDFAAGKIYSSASRDGKPLRISLDKVVPRALPIPAHTPQVPRIPAVREDANTVYRKMGAHPLIVWAYGQELLGHHTLEEQFGKTFDEFINKFLEELEAVLQEQHPQKRAQQIAALERKIARQTEGTLKDHWERVFTQAVREGKIEVPQTWRDFIKDQYFHALKKQIHDYMAGRPTEVFIKEQFKEQMLQSIKDNPQALVIHTSTSADPVTLYAMAGGFLVEQVNPNPSYGLLGAARALYDFTQINRLELNAFREIWQSLPRDERKNFGLQITEVRGTQAGAVMIAWAELLEELDIIPGRDGLRVGVNIHTAANTLDVGRYIEYFNHLGTGLNFVSFDRRMLGAAWPGVDIYWSDGWRRLGTEEEMEQLADIAIKIATAYLEKANQENTQGQEKVVVEFMRKPEEEQKQNKLAGFIDSLQLQHGSVASPDTVTSLNSAVQEAFIEVSI